MPERLRKLYEDWKAYFIPHSDRKVMIPSPPRKSTSTYAPPYRISAEVEPKDNFTDFDQQLKSMLENPKITPPTRKFATLVRKKIEQYATIHARFNTDKTEKKKLGEEISDLAHYTQSRLRETHGEHGSVQNLLDMQSYYEDQDLLLNFGDIFAANLNKIKCWSREKEPWLQTAAWVKNDWHIVSDWIRYEEKQKREYGSIQEPMGENPEGVRSDVTRAAWRLNIDPAELEWEIHLYAERNHMAHLGIIKDAEACRFGHVAKILATLMEKLDCSNISPELKCQYRNAVRLFEREYFEFFNYSDSPPTYGLNSYHQERTRKFIQKQEQEKAEKEEARLQTIEQWEADVQSGRTSLMGGLSRRRTNHTIA